MSLLAALSGKSTSDEEILSQLNEAVMQLQADALGKLDAFALGKKEIEQSRQNVIQLLEILQELLSQTGDLQFVIPDTPQESAAKDIVLKLEYRGRPRADWLEDIHSAISNLRDSKPLSDSDWVLLEDIVDILDTELAEDLRELSRQ
ncbi:MAG: hypothetical protein FJ012_00230 [Chloroflexi bacterium]|nr:hypothetical protein [Chloroflexota bacterium]